MAVFPDKQGFKQVKQPITPSMHMASLFEAGIHDVFLILIKELVCFINGPSSERYDIQQN